jgi:hypothetical protein
MNFAVAAATFAAAALPAAADDLEPMMRQYLETEIAGWAEDPILVAALRGTVR